MPRSAALVATLQVAAGIGALCLMDAMVKWLALRHGAPFTTFGRYASGTIIALAVWQWQGRPGFAPGGLKANLVRGTLIAGMALSFFWAITQLPLALALTLSFVGPLTVPLMASLVLGEPMQPRYVLGGLAGFGGVLVAVGGIPDLAGTRALAVVAVVAAAFMYGATQLILRARAAADGATLITLMGAIVPMALLSPTTIGATLPQGLDLALMLGTGLVGNIGVQLMARGYVHLQAQVSAVLEYSALPWAALLGWLVFDEAVSAATVAGAAIIAAACLWATRTPSKPADAAPVTSPPAPAP
ncbi:DMT family transporter [Sandarakinorhabdus rubra]|uniref:DMT family transporter n=1 Tax=Sandarakinorhabdus rubra TaxID=2672568 RepID=UPI0013DB4F70|nr:DMT family transporter [Sandarakinorhabdus rubra]